MPAPRRRWFAYRLRTLFVVVAVVAVPLAWAGVHVKWLADRHRFLSEMHSPFNWVSEGNESLEPDPYRPIAEAPLSLRVFGEHGVAEIYLRKSEWDKAKLAAKLFPEATIHKYEIPGQP